MMNQPVRAFYHFARSSYAKEITLSDGIDDVHFGLYYPGGGCEAECKVVWRILNSHLAASVVAYDDAWKLFALMPDVFQALAERGTDSNHDSISPEAFCELLTSLGFEDYTTVEG
jgi:hypothetical protein